MSGAIGQRLGTIIKQACGPILGAALLLPLPLAGEAAAEDDLRLARLGHVHRRPYPPNARYKNPPHRHHHKKHHHPRFRPHRYSGHHHHPYRPRRVSYPYYCNHCHAGFHAEHIFHNHVSYVHHVPFGIIPSILIRHGETFFFFAW